MIRKNNKYSKIQKVSHGYIRRERKQLTTIDFQNSINTHVTVLGFTKTRNYWYNIFPYFSLNSIHDKRRIFLF